MGLRTPSRCTGGQLRVRHRLPGNHGRGRTIPGGWRTAAESSAVLAAPAGAGWCADLARGSAEGGPEGPVEAAEVAKAPAKRDCRDRLVGQPRVQQVTPAPLQPQPPHIL